jgi:hypothetical protein
LKILTIDFETYYDQQYSLSKMLTEDYVKDQRFEVILVSVKVNDAPTVWCSGTRMEIGVWLAQFDIPNCGVLAHNAMFDVLILQEIFGIMPAFIFDSMNMAQAHLKPFTGSVSLANCVTYCELGEKGTYVANMMGRPRLSLSRQELHDYAQYCVNDSDKTYALFRHLLPLFPRDELAIIDLTHRMYFNPVLELDADLLAQQLQDERAHKAQLLATLGTQVSKADLLSNDKFAALLQSLGVDPLPQKVSPATGKLTWAFAKNDPEFVAMQEEYEDDPIVSAAIEARLSIKSTITETRTERLLKIAQKYKKLRVPLGYYKAHTGRYGGLQKINLQNPPRVDKSRMRFAIRAPKGHVILGADLMQIEARIVAWLAGCHQLVEAFRRGEDIYSLFATRATGVSTVKKRSKKDDIRRFIGKTCILGLGFGMGAPKLMATLNKEKGVKVDMWEAQRYVNAYRFEYQQIPHMWDKLNSALTSIAQGGRLVIGPCKTGLNVVVLPNDMVLYYNELSKVDGEWVYLYGRETRKLFGGKLAENIVQALARTIVMEHMLAIKRKLGLSPCMQVHDELDYVVPEGEAESYARQITEIMSVPPSWAPDLPVAVEIAYGPTFGDCK